MIIGYKPQFVPLILSGHKIHTIREDACNRWRAGRVMHMATGLRTREYKQFYQDTCKGTQQIEIRYNKGGGVNVFIDEQFFHYQTTWGLPWTENTKAKMRMLAVNDGFTTIAEFFAWFNRNYKGKIIHWTPLVYRCEKEEYEQASLFKL